MHTMLPLGRDTALSSDETTGTIAAYNRHIDQYIAASDTTPAPEVVEWITRTLHVAAKTPHVLELGSGHGVDAEYLEQTGATVVRTDGAQAFVDRLRQLGHDARVLDITRDPIAHDTFDVVYANAVLLHLTREQTRTLIARVRNALRPDGVFAFSVKEGEGAGWSDEKLDAPRYFTYWNATDLRALCVTAGFSDVQIVRTHESGRGLMWLRVIARS
jgi:SAM-dependent methyltransferase